MEHFSSSASYTVWPDIVKKEVCYNCAFVLKLFIVSLDEPNMAAAGGLILEVNMVLTVDRLELGLCSLHRLPFQVFERRVSVIGAEVQA